MVRKVIGDMSINLKEVPRWFCQKVLPLSYDDSLSYYEVLCKLTGKMNEIIFVINDGFETMIREKINRYFVESIYDSSTETLVLSLNEKEI